MTEYFPNSSWTKKVSQEQPTPEQKQFQHLAQRLSLEFRKRIVQEANSSQFQHPYKVQYLLEEVIADMESFV